MGLRRYIPAIIGLLFLAHLFYTGDYYSGDCLSIASAEPVFNGAGYNASMVGGRAFWI